MIDSMNRELEKLDFQKVTQAAIRSTRKARLNANPEDVPSVSRVKGDLIPLLRLSVLTGLSVSMASLLDLLESVTRYPRTKHGSFDKNDPYVIHFQELYDLVVRCLDMSQKT